MQLLQPPRQIKTLMPLRIIPCKSSLRMAQFIILNDMKPIRCLDKSPVQLQVNLHHAKTRSMTQCMMQNKPLEHIQMRLGKSTRSIPGYSMKLANTITSRCLFSGFGSLSILVLPPQGSWTN